MSQPKPSVSVHPKRHVSLKQVAEACNLSEMSVSRALKGLKGVGPKTRQRVLRIAGQLGYIPHRGASILASRRSSTKTVGIILPVLGHTIFPEILDAIESHLSAHDYRFFLCKSNDDPEKEYREAIAMLEHRVDGIIMAPASTWSSHRAVESILQQGCPLVFVDRALEGVEVDTVIFDDYQGAFDAVSHMVSAGCRRIACLSGPEEIWTVQERGRGFRDAIQRAGRRLDEADTIRTDLTCAGGEIAMQTLLDRDAGFDGVFCVAARVAIGALQILNRHGIRIPESMAFVGFSEVLEAEMFKVPLTTVGQDANKLGRIAAQLLISRMQPSSIAHQHPAAQRVCLPTRLIVRGSTL
jgi:LacI family transcriptional regulator